MRRLFLLLLVPLLLAPLEAGKTRRPAPKFVVQLPDGGRFDIADFRGKVVLIEVMKTTCPHCKHSAHTIEKLYRELGSRGFQPVAAAIDEHAEKLVSPYRDREKLTFPIGWTDRRSIDNLLRQPVGKLWYVPQLVFIDRQGTIRAQYGGTDYFLRNEERNIRKLLEELLAE